MTLEQDKIRERVRDGYAKVAREGQSGCGGGGCCGSESELIATIGYTETDLAALPEEANMGLSCGNPTALASLKPGETVLDLGSGGGMDVFVAGPKVGKTGRAIGVDMTPEMLARARRNIEVYRERSGLDNVEFRLGEIENLPAADNSIDVVISNCVINLSPYKDRVWSEIARVLKPGGRVAVSDMALLRELPDEIKNDNTALVGCVAGAVLVEETRQMMDAAGLIEIELRPRSEYIESMTERNDPLYRKGKDPAHGKTNLAEYVTSLDISARKA